jgi:hypothetical protein
MQTLIYGKKYVKGIQGTSKNIIKNQARRLFMPRSIHLRYQKPNPARETVPLTCKDFDNSSSMQYNLTPQHTKTANGKSVKSLLYTKTYSQVWSKRFLNEKMLKWPALATKELMDRGVKMFLLYI